MAHGPGEALGALGDVLRPHRAPRPRMAVVASSRTADHGRPTPWLPLRRDRRPGRLPRMGAVVLRPAAGRGVRAGSPHRRHARRGRSRRVRRVGLAGSAGLAATVGAPPDRFNLAGQDWGTAAVRAASTRAARYGHSSRRSGRSCAVPAGCASTMCWGCSACGGSRPVTIHRVVPTSTIRPTSCSRSWRSSRTVWRDRHRRGPRHGVAGRSTRAAPAPAALDAPRAVRARSALALSAPGHGRRDDPRSSRRSPAS